MENSFYSAFDRERFEDSGQPNPEEYRSSFQIDRDRIIFSFAFRRLQSKTQVFQSGEYDFYRTRLTHSIEVAKLGRSICEFLKIQPDSPLEPSFFIEPGLVEAICLAHDLGHPPFGHIGERKLNQLMAPFGGFEGNAQSARILHRLIYRRPEGPVGMNPSRALIDGVMKYKMCFGEFSPTPDQPHPHNHFLYDSQNDLRALTLGLPDERPLPDDRSSLNAWKSIEGQIMDWADDTAYSLNDIADGIQAGYITLQSLQSWRDQQPALSNEVSEHLDGLAQFIASGAYERRLNFKLGRFIRAVSLHPRSDPLPIDSNRHRFQLEVQEPLRRECDLYKQIAVNLIFRSPQIQQVEFKGSTILENLFQAITHHYLEGHDRPLYILPNPTSSWIREAPDTPRKARLICDFLAGLTDGEAVRLYRRLFDPDFGSITDLA